MTKRIWKDLKKGLKKGSADDKRRQNPEVVYLVDEMSDSIVRLNVGVIDPL
jgi:hypothetical protein